jgi:CRP-like cAMP-binding protein
MPCEHNSCNHFCVHHVPIFNDLTSDDIQLVTSAIQSKRYGKGEYIFREGESSNKLYIVNEGVIKIAKLSDQGKQQIIRFLFPGDFFGLFALLQQKQHYADAEVLDDAIICVIEKQHLTSIMERNPRMAYQFLVAVSERLGQADEWLGTISLMETEQRLAKLLMLFYDKNNNKPDIQLPVQKKELASLLGTTPETLSRKLTLFEDQGLIKVARSYIHILQPRLLQSLAGSYARS